MLSRHSALNIVRFSLHPLFPSSISARTPSSKVAQLIVRPTTVLIVGHTKCGGAEASLKAARGQPLPPGPLGRWLTPLTELTTRLGLQLLPDPEALIKVIEASVREQVAHVAESEPVQAAWKARRNLWVHGLVYELENGKLRHLNVTRGPPA
jgi:carbonic anhydrase